MADGKQQQQSAETAKWAATAQSAKREGLLAKAKERIDKVDVGDDKAHDQKEADVKKKALDFVSNECLTLPEDRFFKLIDAIEIRMKQKEAYKQNLLEEFRKARKEIADSIAADGKPVRENSRVAAETSYVPKKLESDKGPTLLSYLTTIISNDFDPAKFNSPYDMPLLEAMEKYPEIGGQFYSQLLKSSSDHLAGFLTHWKPWHPALVALEKKGMFRAISRITEVEARLRTEFWVPRNSDLWNGNPKEHLKLLQNRITEWKSGDSYSKTWNVAGDIINADRKIFSHKFASKPSAMSESDYNTYVKRSANYLEYAVAAGASGKKEFMEQIDSSTEIATGFIMDWNENNQIYQALKLRGKENVAIEISRLKNEAMKLYGIQMGSNTENNRWKVKDFVRYALNRDDQDKGTERNLATKEAFSSGKDSNPVRSARYLNYATAYGNEKEWVAFVATLKTDKKQFAKFIWNWNENSPLWVEIKRNNGAAAIDKLNALQGQTKRDFGIPGNFGDATTQTALPQIEKYLEVGAKAARERAETREKIDALYSDHRKYVGMLFNRIKEGVIEQDFKKVEKAKNDLVKFSDKTLAPLQTEAAGLPWDFKNGVEMMNPTFKKVASLRVAIEAMNTMSVADTGEVMSAVKWAALSDANKAWIQAKEWQINEILDMKDLGAVVGFTSNLGWLQRTQHLKTQYQFDEEIKTKKISDVNSEAFYQAVCQADVLGTLNLHDLKARWGEYQLLKIALHWGVVEWGKVELNINNSLAFKKLQNDRPNVAWKFLKVLKDAVKEREGALSKISLENADLQSVKDCLKTLKPGIGEKEIEATLASMKSATPDRRLRILEELKWGAELSEKEISGFFTSLEKVKGHEIAKVKKEIGDLGIGDLEIQAFPEMTTLISKASNEFAKKKASEDYDLVTLLTRYDFNHVVKAEDPKGKVPRLRKLSEIRAEDAKKIAAAAEKYLPEWSKLREYFKLHKAKTQMVREQAEYGIQGKSAKAGAMLSHDMKTLPPAAAKKRAESYNDGVVKTAKVVEILKDREDTGMSSAPLTKDENKVVREAEKAVGKASKEGYDLLPGDSSKIGNSEARIRSSEIFRNYLNEVASGKIELSSEQAEVWIKVKDDVPRAPVTPAAGADSHANHNHSGSLGNPSSIDSFTDSKPGERLQIGNGIAAVKTEGGGLEITAGTKKLRFSSAEAEGAVQQIDLLKEAGAEFLIPAMKEIAEASDTRIKDGVGREESARILSTLSRAFGFDSVTKETDPKLMLEKFRTAASGASGDGGIGMKARSLGILDPANNSLKTDVLVKMMGGASVGTEAKSESAAKA